MPRRYTRLNEDVSHAEEAELERLVRGDAPNHGTTSRGDTSTTARECGAGLRDMSTASGGDMSRATWTDVLQAAQDGAPRETAAHEPAAIPCGDSRGHVLAPRAVTRTACLVEQISECKWRVSAGEAVAHFLGLGGLWRRTGRRILCAIACSK